MTRTTWILLFAIGLLPLMAPYELLLKWGWHASGFTFYVGLIVSEVAFLSLAVVGRAILGLNRTFDFDFKSQELIYSRTAAILGLRRILIPFSNTTKVEVVTHRWESGPDTHSLVPITSRGKRFEFGDFSTRQIAEGYKAQILAELGSSIGVQKG